MAKRALAAALAALQAFSLGPGAARALAQTVTPQAAATPLPTVAMPVGGAVLAPPTAPLGGALRSLEPALSPAPTLLLPLSPTAQPRAEASARGLASVATPLAAARASAPAPPGAPAAGRLASSAAPNAAKPAPRLSALAERRSPALAVSEKPGRAEAASEGDRGTADAAFAEVYGERLIARGAGVETPATRGEFQSAPSPARLLRGASRGGRAALPARSARVPAPETGSGAPRAGPSRAFKAAAAGAAAIAVAAALPLLVPHAGLVAAAGSVVLSLVGIPQIIRNFRGGREAVKDLAIASPLIWFAAATLLSVASIGRGASVWWNAANLAGVAESAVVVAQINAYKRDPGDLKASAATAAAVLAPLPLIAAQLLLPLSAWADLAFTAAMGLLWVLNWPQIRRNAKLFAEQGRPPAGVAPLYPALVVGGSLLHLFAAAVGLDFRWILNAVVAILGAGAVLAQIYFPRAANAAIGPLARLQDRAATLLRRASAADPVSSALGSVDLSRFAGTDAPAQIAAAANRAQSLPGRSVIFLQAPTAAGKSTLIGALEAQLGKRVRALEVDRYFKPAAEVPSDRNGQPDFDRPDALYLERAASDLRALLSGGRVELPVHDMASQTTRFDTGEFLTLGEDEVVVIDSIFASHPTLRAAAQGRPSLTLYLEAPAVVRLARRLGRDKVARGKPVVDNLKGWARILDNERAHILPLKAGSDLVLNLVSAEELAGLRAAYAKLLAEEPLERRDEAARLLAAMIRASLAADGVR